jgi:hypothetical protein
MEHPEMTRKPTLLRLAALAAALALAACSGNSDEGNLASLDNQLTGNDSDPALTSALEDQIAVDPELAQQSNRNAVRPPATPTQAPYPNVEGGGGGGAAAARPASLAGGTDCTDASKLNYDPSWARRLPPAFPLMPAAKVTEAAGTNDRGCSTRVVTFRTTDNFQRVLDWYHTQAVRNGYSSEHQIRDGDHVLAGTNEQDGGAFFLIVTPGGSGAEVALITNKGA